MRLVWFREAWYAYDRVDGKPRRTSLRTKDRQEAERQLADLKAALKRKPTTVAEIIQQYLEERGPRLVGLRTAVFAVRRLLPVFGHFRPDQITRTLCRAYATERRRQGVGDGTIRRELAVLNAALHWNQKTTPAVIEFPPPPPPKDLYLTREQYQALREAARSTPHLYLFVILAYSTAGRASAILELTWDRVDFDHGMIRLAAPQSTEKRTKGRAITPMTDGTREALLDARCGALSDYVIEFAGRRVLSVKGAFKAAVLRARLSPRISPHVLRHTAAVHMAEAGIPMAEIAQYLGHNNLQTTYRVYARFSPDHLRRAASALE